MSGGCHGVDEIEMGEPANGLGQRVHTNYGLIAVQSIHDVRMDVGECGAPKAHELTMKF